MLDLQGISIDLSDFIQIAAFLITALFAYFGINAAISLIDGNRPVTKIFEDRWLTDEKGHETFCQRSSIDQGTGKRRTWY